VIDDLEPNQVQVRAWHERRELLRQANARIVENHETGRRIADPLTLHHARMFLRFNRASETCVANDRGNAHLTAAQELEDEPK
jgi:hypothetical protein